MYKRERYQALLNKVGVDLKVGTEVLTPLFAIIDYLRKVNFDKMLYVIGTSEFKEGLKTAGFTLTPEPVSRKHFSNL